MTNTKFALFGYSSLLATLYGGKLGYSAILDYQVQRYISGNELNIFADNALDFLGFFCLLTSAFSFVGLLALTGFLISERGR